MGHVLIKLRRIKTLVQFLHPNYILACTHSNRLNTRKSNVEANKGYGNWTKSVVWVKTELAEVASNYCNRNNTPRFSEPK